MKEEEVHGSCSADIEQNVYIDRPERAVAARRIACEDPKRIQLDDEMLPWVFHEQWGLWISFNGNYSHKSPEEKEGYQRRVEEKAIERHAQGIYWSKVRNDVLERDAYCCQLCGVQAETKLHVHHIQKRRLGGTDHLDNLITVCPSCHKRADNSLYDPDWGNLPFSCVSIEDEQCSQ